MRVALTIGRFLFAAFVALSISATAEEPFKGFPKLDEMDEVSADERQRVMLWLETWDSMAELLGKYALIARCESVTQHKEDVKANVVQIALARDYESAFTRLMYIKQDPVAIQESLDKSEDESSNIVVDIGKRFDLLLLKQKGWFSENGVSPEQFISKDPDNWQSFGPLGFLRMEGLFYPEEIGGSLWLGRRKELASSWGRRARELEIAYCTSIGDITYVYFKKSIHPRVQFTSRVAIQNEVPIAYEELTESLDENGKAVVTRKTGTCNTKWEKHDDWYLPSQVHLKVDADMSYENRASFKWIIRDEVDPKWFHLENLDSIGFSELEDMFSKDGKRK